jgi:hypothetical protein
MNHIILLGDSIFDNAAYTAGGPAVIQHLRQKLPPGWEATLLAVDGSVTGDVVRQIANLPPGATHLIVSAGGNDALTHSGLLSEPARSVAEVLQRLSALQRVFEQVYRQMLMSLLAFKLPTSLCTVYYPNFSDAVVQEISSMGLMVFNETILRLAFQTGLPVIDLRFICSTPEDYANEIEPSVSGGAKIAGVILKTVRQHDFGVKRTIIYY